MSLLVICLHFRASVVHIRLRCAFTSCVSSLLFHLNVILPYTVAATSYTPFLQRLPLWSSLQRNTQISEQDGQSSRYQRSLVLGLWRKGLSNNLFPTMKQKSHLRHMGNLSRRTPSHTHHSSSSSSFYWASVANNPNVLQPYWLIALPLDFLALTASLLLWGPSGQRWRCSWTFLFSNVPTSRLQEILAAKVELHGREMADEFCLKMPYFHLTFWDLLHAVNLRYGTNSFTSRPKEGVLRIFSPWKLQRLRSGLKPRTWVPKASTLPLDHRSRCTALLQHRTQFHSRTPFTLCHFGHPKLLITARVELRLTFNVSEP